MISKFIVSWNLALWQRTPQAPHTVEKAVACGGAGSHDHTFPYSRRKTRGSQETLHLCCFWCESCLAPQGPWHCLCGEQHWL